MPLRDAEISVSILAREAEKITRNNKRSKDRRSFLSDLQKQDTITGVVCLTILFSGAEWDGPKNLSQMVGQKGNLGYRMISEPLNLIVPGRMKIQEIRKYGNVLAPVFIAMKFSGSRNRTRNMLRVFGKEFEKIDYRAFNVKNTILNLKINPNRYSNQEGSVNMSNGWLDWLNESVQKGRAEGRREGRAEVRKKQARIRERESRSSVLEMKKDGLENKTIARYLHRNVEDVARVLSRNPE